MEQSQKFGERLKEIRKSLGYSQQSLADKLGVSRRIISYYECESDYPPSKILIDLSLALNISTDVLLGLDAIKADRRTVDAKFWPKWEVLNPEDRKAVSKVVDALLAAKTK
jgi:transcriptional regulator with XRE-family HTH domain